jgi:hypothetical protein
MIDISRCDPGLGETVVDRTHRKVSVMLATAEPFLLGSRNDLAVHDQRRG